MKCYQYNNQGYFQFVTEDYGQGLPRNATYMEPLEEKEGYLLKFNGASWEREEVPKEEGEAHSPTQQDLLDQLNVWLSSENNRVANNLALDLAAGVTLKEAQAVAQEDAKAVTKKYEEMLTAILSGENPFNNQEA